MVTMVEENNTISDTLPPHLELCLSMIGVVEPTRLKHTQVTLPEETEDITESRGWLPSYPGEEPPF